MHTRQTKPSSLGSSHNDVPALAPAGSTAATSGFTLFADLHPGHEALSRPLGELGAACRNKLGKEWRDVSRWAIARSSFDRLGSEWKSTSEFRVASETLVRLDSEVAARKALELLPAVKIEEAPGNVPVPADMLTPLPTGYQLRARDWAANCFGEQVASDPRERNRRFLEEAVELAQAAGATAAEAHQLVDYVFGRPVGDFPQEVGGTMLTLALLCQARGESMEACGEVELARVWQKLEQIREKQAAKKSDSPLPGGQVITNADVASLGSSPVSRGGVELRASDLNHLRRLLAWVACEIGQAPDELVKTVQGLLPALGHEVADEAKLRLVQAHREAASVPQYVRTAIKALGKRTGALCDLEDAEGLGESQEHPT